MEPSIGKEIASNAIRHQDSYIFSADGNDVSINSKF
jgi:hypothetical protein